MLPPDLRRDLPAIKARLSASVETVWADGNIGPEPVNPDGAAAIRLLDGIFQYIERLQDRLEHDRDCMANDMEPLDHTPCTCGLHDLYDPWGRKAKDLAGNAIDVEVAK